MRNCLIAVLAAAVAVTGLQSASGAHADQSGAARTAAATANSSREQATAISTMARLIKELGADDALEAARTELTRITKDQKTLGDQAQTILKTTVGLRPEQVPPDVAKKLQQLAGDQAALAQRTKNLISAMKTAADPLKQSDPSTAQILKNVAQVGEKADVPGSQRNAGDATLKNQLGTTTSDQSQAMTGLRQMGEEMDRIGQLQLEKLRRQLAELIEQVKHLKAGEGTVFQSALVAVTSPASSSQTSATKLADAQQTLQMNAIVLANTARETREAADAADDIAAAGARMGDAAAPLYAHLPAASFGPETGALAYLDDAIRKLEKKQDDVANKIKQKDLAEFVKEYEQIRTAQTTIDGASDTIESRRQTAADHQVDRPGLLQLAHLAGVQSDLTQHVTKLSSDEKLKDYAVIVWMNGQIAGAMNASHNALAKAQTGPQLALVQSTAIDRLTDLINALKEEQQQKPDSFEVPIDLPNGSHSNEPGIGIDSKRPLVPPVAQLKLIKAMQGVVNAQTADVNRALSAALTDAERGPLLDQAAQLGKTQAQLKTIVEKMVRQMH